VDDILIASQSEARILKFKDTIQKRFKMVDGGLATYYTGFEIQQSPSTGTISISQTKYIRDLLAKAKMADAKSFATPLPTGLQLQKAAPDDPLIEKPEVYRSLVGALLYASTSTRVDIATAVAQLCKYMQEPRQSHDAALKHVLRYLSGSASLSLTYRRESSFEVLGFSDASFAQDLDSRKSTTGYAFTISGGAVSWNSKQQTIVATSTMESELIAASAASDEAIFIRQLLLDLTLGPTNPIKILCDNQPMLHMVTNSTTTSKNKHIDIKFRSIEERVIKGYVSLEYKPSEYLPADLLTKNLPAPAFASHRKVLMNVAA
jgi:hypothetical protein